MKKNIKLIWDFRGADAIKTAEHHEIHLSEYLDKVKHSPKITGVEVISDYYAIAYLVVPEKDMIQFRDALIPHRGEIYEE
jgi:hypothetical protein